MIYIRSKKISRPYMILWSPMQHSSIHDFLWSERKTYKFAQRETAWPSLVLFSEGNVNICSFLFEFITKFLVCPCSQVYSGLGGARLGLNAFPSYFFIQSGVPCTIFWQHKNKEKGDKTLFCYINIYSNPILLKRIANILLFSRKINADI